jgi:hypothetical protein
MARADLPDAVGPTNATITPVPGAFDTFSLWSLSLSTRDQPEGVAVATFDDAKKKADELVDQAKSTVSGLADQQGNKVAEVVDKLTDTFDDKTGGSASAVTAKVDEVVAGALDKAQAASSTLSQKATEATNAVKGAVSKKPADT